jgi:antitoxin (DNA-binding transcriptional repressor) of toxin-antitoxin stability system
MVKVNIAELKAKLSHYLQLMQSGETIIVMKRNVCIAEIKPPTPTKERKIGPGHELYPHWKGDLSAAIEPLDNQTIEAMDTTPIFPEQ